jgi:2-aminoadipate transaminase
LTENPTYIGALQAFNFYGARYAAIDLDQDGMRVEQVEENIRKYHPRLIYSVPTFQNPTGMTLSIARRRKLCEVAAKYSVPIVEDSPYGEIRFAGSPVVSLKSIGGDAVIALRTFSKTMTPGLRVAWINAAPPFIALLEKVKQFLDLHSSSFTQYLVYEYMRQGMLEPHIEEIKADYLKKRNLMVRALEETFPSGISWTKPEGGLFLWLELPRQVSASKMFQKALDLKVAYVPGKPFYPNGGGENTLRLNFSNSTPDMIVEGINRLAKLFRENL